MRRSALGLLTLAAACSNDPPTGPCTADVRPGIVVTIRDGATGQPVADRALGQVEDHRHAEPLEPYGYEGTPSALASRAAAFERPGTYEVTVFASGYEPWVRRDVVVDETRDGCHVLTVELEAALEPHT